MHLFGVRTILMQWLMLSTRTIADSQANSPEVGIFCLCGGGIHFFLTMPCVSIFTMQCRYRWPEMVFNTIWLTQRYVRFYSRFFFRFLAPAVLQFWYALCLQVLHIISVNVLIHAFYRIRSSWSNLHVFFATYCQIAYNFVQCEMKLPSLWYFLK